MSKSTAASPTNSLSCLPRHQSACGQRCGRLAGASRNDEPQNGIAPIPEHNNMKQTDHCDLILVCKLWLSILFEHRSSFCWLPESVQIIKTKSSNIYQNRSSLARWNSMEWISQIITVYNWTGHHHIWNLRMTSSWLLSGPIFCSATRPPVVASRVSPPPRWMILNQNFKNVKSGL